MTINYTYHVLSIIDFSPVGI